MKLRLLLLALVIVVAASAQVTTPAPPALHVISPKAGEKLSANFVTVRWELLNPTAAAAGTPNFELRLDGQDPIHTSDTEFTFSGLAGGRHTIIFQLVDANGTPINGASAQVSFTVANPVPTPTDATPDHTHMVRQASVARNAMPHGSRAGTLVSRI